MAEEGEGLEANEPKNISIGFVAELASSFYGVDKGEIDSLIKESGEEGVLKLLSEKQQGVISSQKEKYSLNREEVLSEGFRKGASKVEKEQRELFKIPDSVKREDINDYIASLVNRVDSEKSNVELNDDLVKSHQTYKELQKERDRLEADRQEAIQKAVQEVEQRYSQKEEASKLNSHMDNLLLDDNLNYREGFVDVDKANIKRDIMNSGYKFSWGKNGDVEVLTEDGKLAEDNLGKIITFNDVFTNVAKRQVGYKAAEHRESTGEKPNQVRGNSSTVRRVDSKEEFNNILYTLDTIEKKQEFTQLNKHLFSSK